MSLLSEKDFHHRIDLFEPGDRTALVCIDVPEVQRIVVENLTEVGCKIHTGFFIEDILLKLQAHAYDVVIFSEHFNATDLRTNPILAATIELPPNQRRKQMIILVGSSLHTDSEMHAWANSVDLTVNLADVANLKHILRRATQRVKDFYTPYTEAVNTAGFL